MAAETCNISFKIDYTSSKPIKSAIAYYKNKNGSPSDPYSEYNINPIPSSSDTVKLPFIQDEGDYELIVELMDEDGVIAKEKSLFKIGNCNPSACETPVINKVDVLSNGQIVMDYTVLNLGSWSPEYQIATDSSFAKIVHSTVGFQYNQIENIQMDSGDIPNDTVLYIRARKYCTPAGTVSDWSNVIQFTSGTYYPVLIAWDNAGTDLSTHYDNSSSAYLYSVRISTYEGAIKATEWELTDVTLGSAWVLENNGSGTTSHAFGFDPVNHNYSMRLKVTYSNGKILYSNVISRDYKISQLYSFGVSFHDDTASACRTTKDTHLLGFDTLTPHIGSQLYNSNGTPVTGGSYSYIKIYNYGQQVGDKIFSITGATGILQTDISCLIDP
ncbi:hypothetical protein [Chryseobacterium sp. SL1]|uniref:hypothetical protein n=1 Tax=Chryseobacterium sp. SL1 TaxID=2995159 RepID=UPI002273E7C5|nr:hypothetical protein [Chryseobacterium sp. SL1]MCY1662536.1 hypothetical protein [Chryseobacterium sp. SL1]